MASGKPYVSRIAVIIAAASAGIAGLGASAPGMAQVTDTPAGTYAQTCSDAYVSQGRLYAHCLDMRGRRYSTSIELAPCAASDIGNDDGLLVCHGLRGRRENVEAGGSGGRPGGDRDRDRDRGGPGWGGGGRDGPRGGGDGLVDYTLNATYGDWNFPSWNDPMTVAVYAGGRVRAADVSRGCEGWISRAPDVQINYASSGRPLIFSVDSDGDTTLVINGPDGRWSCDDDGGYYGLNPALQYNRPQSGVYDVWIGSYARDRNDAATLYVSERESQ